ncbi:carboxylating nicotinate-nucleotide diphosphorylase [Alkalicella caledoniensis]|uniref:Probable nicotinate-nucleotide pyrophosphorylase [carboxylating] n=1 Tax=Alkalicella caledoniensis TaxID=2731377 RepID=A0A7G9W836_ALKCA|nr:carboxylating nicotinate-nucleotide diphosphorylase [Alkalicella caledoniensis]QNO14848.1 carboxylating nicotinate-nucleotide diphosphorylase [Alkalicella caledoniensis]
MQMNRLLMEKALRDFLIEDLGTGDMSTFMIDENLNTQAVIHSKANGVVCGLEIAKMVFEILDKDMIFSSKVTEGTYVTKGTTIATVEGKAKIILQGERLALNLLQRLCAVATMADTYQKKVEKYGVYVTDTRKTTPGLRIFEKYAVQIGGGRNHRFGLYDAVMLKDNHIKIAGSITKAISDLKSQIPHTMKIEVEVENLEQVKEALENRADIIMLDNMSIEDMKEAVKIIDKKALVEASGGITLETIEEVAKTGVDYISVGALTHSYKSMDISLDMFQKKG